MRKFLRTLFPDAEGTTGGEAATEASEGAEATEDVSIGSAVEKALSEQEEGASAAGEEGAAADDKKAEEKPAAEEEGMIEVNGEKMKDRRSKGYDGERRRAADKAAENPEFDVDFEVEVKDGEPRKKLSLTELKEAAKFLNQNKQSIGASLKIREMATKNPEFGKLLNSIISKSHNESGEFNADFVKNTLESLDKKATAVEDKIEDTDADIKAAEDLLNSDDIDPDSVQAQVLKSNIKAMKATKAQLTQALAKIENVEKKFGEVEKSQQTFVSEQGKAEEKKEVERVSGIFDKEFNAIMDPKRDKAFQFVDDEERKHFETSVRNVVAKEAGKKDSGIKTDEDFVKAIRQAGDAVYKRLQTIREAAVNDYIRKKGLPAPAKGDDSKDTAVSVDRMKEQLASLEKDGKKDSPEAEKLRKAIAEEQAKIDDPTGGKSIGELLADAMYAEA